MRVLNKDGNSYTLKDKSLESMQKVVEGYIELVPIYHEDFPNHLLVVNDYMPQNKRHGHNCNRYASELARQPIYGNAILAVKDEIN